MTKASFVSGTAKALLAGVLAGVLGACEAGGVPAPAPVHVADSAGVRLVQHSGLTGGGPRFALAPEPDWIHGHGMDDLSFQGAWLGRLLPGGGAVAYAMSSGELVQVDSGGAPPRILARRGRGPEEVAQITSLHVMGDGTLLAHDAGNGRVTRFEDGRVTGTTSLLEAPGLARFGTVKGVDPEGTLLAATTGYMSGFEAPWLEGHLMRLETEPLRVDTVGTFPLAMGTPPTRPENPFRPGGRAEVSGGSFLQVRTDRAEVAWRDSRGAVFQVVRWEAPPRHPTPADWERFVGALRIDMRRVNPGRPQNEIDQLVEGLLQRYALHPDEPLPVFSETVTDGEGGIWLGEFRPEPGLPARRFTVIPRDGGWIGTAEVPEGFRLLDIRGDRVLGLLPDEWDVEALAVFRLVPSGG